MLARRQEIPVMFIAFDLLVENGEPLLSLPYRERRSRLEALELAGPHWATTVATDDGAELWRWTCDKGLEGIVAKRASEWYRPGERRWLKIKNHDYWRYPLEVEALRRRIYPAWRRAHGRAFWRPSPVAVGWCDPTAIRPSGC